MTTPKVGLWLPCICAYVYIQHSHEHTSSQQETNKSPRCPPPFIAKVRVTLVHTCFLYLPPAPYLPSSSTLSTSIPRTFCLPDLSETKALLPSRQPQASSICPLLTSWSSAWLLLVQVEDPFTFGSFLSICLKRHS